MCGCSCPALMWPALIVAGQVGVENGLRLVDGLEPGATALDTEVLVEQRPVQPLDDTIGLRSLHPCGAVGNVLELQEQLVGVLVGATAELPAIVGQRVGRNSEAYCAVSVPRVG